MESPKNIIGRANTMKNDIYYIPKTSNTYADTLAAYGFTAILNEVLNQMRGRIEHGLMIQDVGSHYIVAQATKPLTSAEIENCSFFATAGESGFYITQNPRPPKDGNPPEPQPLPPSQAVIKNIDTIWDTVRIYSQHKKEGWEKGFRKREELDTYLQDQMAFPPDYYWQTAVWLADYKMQALSNYNRLVTKWSSCADYFPTTLEALLAMFATPYMEVESIAQIWAENTSKTLVADIYETNSQLLNPHRGKGQNSTKANGFNDEKKKDTFWLFEHLKAVGIWLAAAPRVTATSRKKQGQGKSEKTIRKTYVLNPQQLHFSDYQAIFEQFSNRLWNELEKDKTTVKLDITSLLLYLDTLLTHSEVAQDENDGDPFASFNRVVNLVNGMHLVQYQLLSQHSYTVTHIGFLALPNWLERIESAEEVIAMQAVIREHINIIRSIDESKSSGYNLLRLYRQFLTGQELAAFFAFIVGFSNYLMSESHTALSKGERPTVWQFSENCMEVLMSKVKKDYTPILANEGFINIARAIRSSTVDAQRYRYEAQFQHSVRKEYDVQYGLGQDIANKAHDADEFIATLGKFIGQYNTESARIRERVARRNNGTIPEKEEKELRWPLSETDIAELLPLIAEYGSEVICHLLIAIGYSRWPKKS